MQELLAALHGHLGSGQAAEVTAALQVLHTLAHTHGQTLLQHVGFISSLLDCLPSLTQAQMHQVNHFGDVVLAINASILCGSTPLPLFMVANEVHAAVARSQVQYVATARLRMVYNGLCKRDCLSGT